jgi:hypothetical protein
MENKVNQNLIIRTELFFIALLSCKGIAAGRPDLLNLGKEIEGSSSLIDEIRSPAIHFCITS